MLQIKSLQHKVISYLVSNYKFLPVLITLVAGSLFFFAIRSTSPEVKGVNVLVYDINRPDSIHPVNDSLVMPVLYKKVPDFREEHYKERVKYFVEMMLPSVLLAQEKMKLKQQKLLKINAALQSGIVSDKDLVYLEKVKEFYKTNDVDDIIKRLHPHPVSIVLAQAAIESGWGTSRFCYEANNMYGIWSFNASENRIKAGESRSGKNIYLRKYDSIFESVYDYLETLAKVRAYKQFRDARLYSDNPFRLIWYLNNYSEKRYEYVHTLRNVIEYNNLHRYDHYRLVKINKKDKFFKELLEE
jgi:Bax protein